MVGEGRKRRGARRGRPACAARGPGGLVLRAGRAAEHVLVPVVDFESQRIDRDPVDPAAFGAPAIPLAVPGPVEAAILLRVLAGDEGVLHRLVPLAPQASVRAVVLEE